MAYQIGDTVRLSTTFAVGVAETLTDPTTVTLAYTTPAGATTTLVYLTDAAVVRDSTGTYHADVSASTAGVWSWKWTGTGAAAGIDEGTFTVDADLSAAPVLVSVDEVKAALEITTTDADDLIQTLIVAASRAISERYQREFVGPSATARVFGLSGRLLDLAPFDLRTATSITLHPEEGAYALAADADYLLLPQGGSSLGGAYQQVRFSSRLAFTSTVAREFGEARVSILGDWGCFSATAVPESLRRGAVVTVSSWLDRAIAEYGILPDDGRDLRPDRASTWAIPAAAHSIFMPWARLGTP